MPKNAKKPKSRATEPASKSTMLVNRLKPKQSPDEAAAEMMVEGLGMNAITATRQVQRGNLGGQEALLTAQAVTLNAMFTQLALQSAGYSKTFGELDFTECMAALIAELTLM